MELKARGSLAHLGLCNVSGCDQQAITIEIVGSTNYAGATALCQKHLDIARQNSERQKGKKNKKGKGKEYR